MSNALNKVRTISFLAVMVFCLILGAFYPGYLDMTSNSVYTNIITQNGCLNNLHASLFFGGWQKLYQFLPAYSIGIMYFLLLLFFIMGVALFCFYLDLREFETGLIFLLIILFPSNIVLLTYLQKEFFMYAALMFFMACTICLQRSKSSKGLWFIGAFIALICMLNARLDSLPMIFLFSCWLFVSARNINNSSFSSVVKTIIGGGLIVFFCLFFITVIEKNNKVAPAFPAIQLPLSDIGAFVAISKTNYLYSFTPQAKRGASNSQDHAEYLAKKYLANKYYFIDDLLWRGPEAWRLDSLVFYNSEEAAASRAELQNKYFYLLGQEPFIFIKRHFELWWFMLTRSGYWVKKLGFEQPDHEYKDTQLFFDEARGLTPRLVHEGNILWKIINNYIQFFPEHPIYALWFYFVLSGLLLACGFLARGLKPIVQYGYFWNACWILSAGVVYILERYFIIINPSYRYGQIIILTTMIGVILFVRELLGARGSLNKRGFM